MLCYAAGLVKLADGRNVSVSEIVAGDDVLTPDGPVKVRCVVATACEGGRAELVELKGGVLVTPWHPVRVSGTHEWKFPADLASTSTYPCHTVYSFVLQEGSPFLQIGPYDSVTLGHGISHDSVASHEYLGTYRVLMDLSAMDGWNTGKINLAPNPAVHDPRTGIIVAFKQGKSKSTEDPSVESESIAKSLCV